VVLVAYRQGADHQRDRQGAEASRQVAVDFLDPLAEQ